MEFFGAIYLAAILSVHWEKVIVIYGCDQIKFSSVNEMENQFENSHDSLPETKELKNASEADTLPMDAKAPNEVQEKEMR